MAGLLDGIAPPPEASVAEAALCLFFFGALLLASLADLKSRHIPDRLLLAAALPRLIWLLAWQGPRGLAAFAAGGLAVSLPALLITLALERRWGGEAMGGGDIKLIFVIGVYLGAARTVIALLFACVAAALFAVLKKGGDGELPFGPFLSAGAAFAFLFGEAAISAYISLFA